MIVPMVIWFSRVQRKYRQQRESTGGIVAILENVLSGITVVQAYNASDFERVRIEGQSGNYRDQAIQAAFIRNRFIPGFHIVAGISFGLLVSAGGWLMIQDKLAWSICNIPVDFYQNDHATMDLRNVTESITER